MCFQRTEYRPYVSLYDCPALPFDVFALLALTQHCSFRFYTTLRFGATRVTGIHYGHVNSTPKRIRDPAGRAQPISHPSSQTLGRNALSPPYTCFELLRPHMCHHTLATCTVEHVHDIHVPAHVACKLGCGRSLSVSVALRLRSWRLYAFRKLH